LWILLEDGNSPYLAWPGTRILATSFCTRPCRVCTLKGLNHPGKDAPHQASQKIEKPNEKLPKKSLQILNPVTPQATQEFLV
jgi:hypothetical protein